MNHFTAARRSLAAAGALLLAATALAGCSAAEVAPSTRATEPSSSAPAPTPTVEPIDTVAAIVARPESLQLQDAAGNVVGELSYVGDVDSAIATIEQVLDAAPVDEEYPGSSHFAPSTAHRWGALEIWEHRYVENWAEFAAQERTIGMPSFGVVFTGSDTAGVTLSTAQDVVAGSPWSDLEAMPDLQSNPSGCSGPYLDYVASDVTWPDGTVHEVRYGVDFIASADGSVIERVRAPLNVNAEACA